MNKNYYQENIWDLFGKAALLVGFIAVIFLILIIFNKAKTEKNCTESVSTLTSKTFKCPETKLFVHMFVIGSSASAMCCEKE